MNRSFEATAVSGVASSRSLFPKTASNRDSDDQTLDLFSNNRHTTRSPRYLALRSPCLLSPRTPTAKRMPIRSWKWLIWREHWEADQGGSSSVVQKPQDNLAALYMPPFKLMFQASFEKAKLAASSENKWLLVNLQSTTEFSSQMVNRDTWANEVVAQTIKSNFIFWHSVLSGYNGTIMAYGQTGTGKTFTVGNVGKNDTSERGIMVRALEDILAATSPENDVIEFSFLQLYMESVQDLLSPEKVNIPIVEDSKTGEVSVPGAEIVQVQDLDHFMHLLQRGDSNRHAANTKMNTNSSRSHAILMVNVTHNPQKISCQ